MSPKGESYRGMPSRAAGIILFGRLYRAHTTESAADHLAEETGPEHVIGVRIRDGLTWSNRMDGGGQGLFHRATEEGGITETKEDRHQSRNPAGILENMFIVDTVAR